MEEREGYVLVKDVHGRPVYVGVRNFDPEYLEGWERLRDFVLGSFGISPDTLRGE